MRFADLAPALAVIPAGTVEVRDARSGSSREVPLLPFQIGRTPVTRGQWQAVVDLVEPSGAELSGIPSPNMPASDSPASDGPPDVPAHPVTWFDAVQWCNRAAAADGLTPAYQISGRNVLWDVSADGFRLPTEAEWEWACRAGTEAATYGPLADIAWTAADQLTEPQAVAGKLANAFGLFDTIGNVWEWCWDYGDTARYGDYRSLRGGGWDDPPWSCRASVRRGSAPDAVLDDVGFRVARGAVGESGALAAQGWSAAADRARADVRGPRPIGWTPLRDRPDETGRTSLPDVH